MINKLKGFFKKEKGQGLVEYGLILALISVLSIGAVSGVGGSVKETVQNIVDEIEMSSIPVPPEMDEDFIWVYEPVPNSPNHGYMSSNPEDVGRGYYKYIGDAKEVVIPHVIRGHTVRSYYKMFRGSGATKVIHNNPLVKDTVYMFLSSSADEIDFSEFDTSNITDMHGMFEGARVSTLDLTPFDTSKVTTMQVMFYGTQAKSIDLSSFDTSKVSSTAHMFWKAKVEELDLSTFNTRRVRDHHGMFSGVAARVGLARTQADADMMNATKDKPDELIFTVKP